MSGSRRIVTIARSELELVASLAQSTYPEECCGWLVGRQRPEGVRVVEIEPTDNQACDRRERFEISPSATLAASQRAARRGYELVGTFHSHPDREARPSPLDLESLWGDASHLISAVEAGRPAGVRCWRIEDRVAFEETLLVVSEEEG